MRTRTCKKCFASIGWTAVWVNGSPYCHECAEIKKAQIEKRNSK